MYANLSSCKESTNWTKTQNDYLLQFLERRDEFLKMLYVMEAPPANRSCSHCGKAPGAYRCQDCFGATFLCSECTRGIHEYSPFHRIEEWSGTHFKMASLWQVGIKLFLGHLGGRCPNHGRPADCQTSEDAPCEDTSAVDEEDQDGESWESRIAHIREEFYDPEEEIDDELDPDDPQVVADQHSFENPGMVPRHPKVDAEDNNFITIVDTSGVHHLPYVECFCRHQKSIDLQFLEVGLFPASYKRIRTAFTFRVLDDFRLENLECKVSAYQYYHKIRRITDPTFPEAVANRYIELRRLSRAWRNLRLRQRFGFSYPGDHSQAGAMAIFCAACPQLGINMKEGWEKEPDKELKHREMGLDGNFKSEHVFQQRTILDVVLCDGLMFMTKDGPYQLHLEAALTLARKLGKQLVSRELSQCPTNIDIYSRLHRPNVIDIM